MRAFIAIELDPKIRNYLKDFQARLKKSGADVKLVEPQNIHLTLKFLGEIDEGQCQKIFQIIDDISGSNPAFDMALGSPGAFPKTSSPRVIWVGVNSGSKEAARIAEELEEKTSLLGIPGETKKFSPHLTIARTKSNFNIGALIQELKTLEGTVSGLKFRADSITLFKSTLTPGGPLYEVLKKTSLKTA